MAVIIITGNPISGHNFYGPFDTPEDAIAASDDLTEGGDWWVAPLVTPEAEQDDNQLELPLHYPGAAIPIPPAHWMPTHFNKRDGSPIKLVEKLPHALRGGTGMLWVVENEHGEQFTTNPDEWEVAS